MLQHIEGYPVYGNHEDQTIRQFLDVVNRAEYGALMADGHLGYVMPIGGVAAYRNKVSAVGVGFDIGCGNLAVRLDMKKKELKLDLLLDRIEKQISFGIGQTNPDAPRDHPIFESDKWDAYEPASLRADLRKLAREQLGTVGAGNHYVDIFADEQDRIWVGVHFGSRGLGHKTATGFINLSQDRPWNIRAVEKEVLLDLDSDLGERYYRAMQLCGAYARAGREWVCDYVAKLAGAEIVERVHNHHNYAWKEQHHDAGTLKSRTNGTSGSHKPILRDYIVIRKGATPAFPGQLSFVGGSMGDPSVILEGVDSPESRSALYSTIHGAGRVMSRTKAAGKYRGRGKKRKQIRAGEVTPKMMQEWLRKKNVKLRGGGLDESPHVYRRLTEVLNAHQNTIRIRHWLQPLGVVMAGPDVFDPFID
jgi:tRNA-splicing ligase RtcB (3'-phosphate/5'-hydroxy nucleic acid ligase)